MSITAVVDLVCAVFMGILYARNFSNRDLSKSSRLLNLCLAVMLASLLTDASAYTFIGPRYPVPFRFFINLLSFEATCVNVILFTFYEEALFRENGKVNPWFFRSIKIVEIIWAFATAYEFIAGHLLTYSTNGVENLDYAFPTYIVVLNLAIQCYLAAITIINSRKIGKDLALLLSIFFIAPVFTSILFSFLGVDFAYAFGAVMLGLVAEFIQRKHLQKVQQEQTATQELATQQRYLKSFGDMVNAALWSISINDANEVTGVKWSDEVRNMLGLTREEYPDRLEAWLERLHPDDRGRTEEAFNQGLDTTDTENYVYDLEYRLRKKSGEYCWYHALGRMEYNNDGTRKLYGIIYDMTADKKLEEKQKQLEEALTATNLETRRTDVLTEIISGSKFTYDISADDEVIGAHYTEVSIARIGEEYTKTPMGWFELLHPEDKERVYNAFMATVRDHSGKTLYNETFRMMGTNGNYRWVRSGGNVIRRADGSGEFLGISLDMTRQMEEQQRRLLGAMPLSNDVMKKANIGMWAFELDEGQPPRMYDDETMLGLVGLDHQVPPEEAYHAWYDHIDEGSYDLVNDAVAKMMDGEHAEVQYPWHYPDGRTIIVRCGGVRNFGYTKGIRIEGTHQNVTETLHFDEEERKREQRQKEDEIARVKAEAADKAKTEFLFNMSHDIRTPMNAILGYTDIALNHINEQERVNDSLKKIKTSGGHLLNLINDILEMSRIEAGRMEIINIPVNIYEASEGIVNMSQALASTKDIIFRAEIGSVKNAYIYSDELHTNQIIINLISNAIKYTNPGGKVDYRIEQISDPENGIAHYRVTVKDNGIGMSEEFQKHLFESFAREQTATVSRQEGAGLGLAIVKRIVDLCGGTITVQSKPGEGSTFMVELPLKVMNDAEIDAFEKSRHADTEVSMDISLEGKKVLLVEDNEMNREIATEILEDNGLIVESAEDGALAVRKVMERGTVYYDFILMDIQMPVMNGYEATAEIRKLPEGDIVPIIALSANAFKEDKEKSFAAGMNDHVAKPINIKELFTALAKFL